MAKLNWDNFKNQFDESWHKWVKPIIESQKFAENFQELKVQSKLSKTFPSSSSGNLFRIFREVKFNDMIIAVVGLSPYNKMKNGVEIADGIALSCSNTKEEQPSLKQWYTAMEKEFGKGIIRDTDLSYLTKQGVFMYNYSLTAPIDDPKGHIPIWELFSKMLFSTAIVESKVPVITLGKEAAKVLDTLMPWTPYWELSHPASASYAKKDWDSEGAFKESQDYLHGQGHVFKWVKTKNSF